MCGLGPRFILHRTDRSQGAIRTVSTHPKKGNHWSVPARENDRPEASGTSAKRVSLDENADV